MHRGILLMGYLGVMGFGGKSSAESDPVASSGTALARPFGVGAGLRLGGLLGFFASPMLSLNAELTLDFPSTSTPGTGNDLTAVRAAFSFSPLFHMDAGNLDLAIGPKLGVWTMDLSQPNFDGDDTLSYRGWNVGVNVAAMVKLGHVSLGGLFALDSDHVDTACLALDGGGDDCQSVNDVSSQTVLSFTGVILF